MALAEIDSAANTGVSTAGYLHKYSTKTQSESQGETKLGDSARALCSSSLAGSIMKIPLQTLDKGQVRAKEAAMYLIHSHVHIKGYDCVLLMASLH